MAKLDGIQASKRQLNMLHGNTHPTVMTATCCNSILFLIKTHYSDIFIYLDSQTSFSKAMEKQCRTNNK